MGELRAPRGRAPRRVGARHHAVGAAGRARPRARARGRAGRIGSRSRCATTATWAASASTRSPPSAWSSTWGTSASRSTRAPCTTCSSRAAGCSTTASRGSRTTATREGEFTLRFVFPDGKLLHLGRVVDALERAGFEPEHVEGLREDYAETLRHWARRLDEQPRGGRPPGRRGARARVAAVPARRPQQLRDRLQLGVPGALHPAAAQSRRLRKNLPASVIPAPT